MTLNLSPGYQKSKLETALQLAAKGYHIFPANKNKTPLIKDWPNEATTNPDKIKYWFESFPKMNIAVVTGIKSNFFVLDIDGSEGQLSFTKLKATYGEIHVDKACIAKTPSDGLHYYFQMPKYLEIKNSASKIGPKLDIRANGGYVLIPPDIVTNRQGQEGAYEYVTGITLLNKLPEAPEWLLALVAERKTLAVSKENQTNAKLLDFQRTTAYGQKALDEECQNIGTAPEGMRNDTLYRSAIKIWSLVIGGEINEHDAERILFTAALECGLEVPEITPTLKSAKTYAFRHPRSAPNRSNKAPITDTSKSERHFNILPDCPLHIFPQEIRKMLLKAAKAFKHLPIEVPVVAFLSLLAACVGHSRVAVVQDGWEESGNLYMCIVAGSGLGKSPCFKAFFKTLWEHEAKNKIKYDAEMAIYNEIMEKRRRTKDLSELADLPPHPIWTQYIIDDATTEALSGGFLHNPRGLLWYCDELSALLLNLDRYISSKGGTKARLLSTYDGSPWKISRKERELVISSAVLSIVATTQPAVLKELFGQNDAASGFLPRFIFILTKRQSPAYLTNETFDGQELLRRITEHILEWTMVNENDKWVPNKVTLSVEAYDCYQKWHNIMAATAWTESEISKTIVPKLTTQVARLALLLHSLKAALDNNDGLSAISANTMNEAISLGEWVFAHQKKIWQALNISTSPINTPLKKAIVEATLQLEDALRFDDWKIPNNDFHKVVCHNYGQDVDKGQVGRTAAELGITNILIGRNIRGKAFSAELIESFKIHYYL